VEENLGVRKHKLRPLNLGCWNRHTIKGTIREEGARGWQTRPNPSETDAYFFTQREELLRHKVKVERPQLKETYDHIREEERE